jgi:lipoprotein-anchoring transpeptidase ErfK/SrfK
VFAITVVAVSFLLLATLGKAVAGGTTDGSLGVTVAAPGAAKAPAKAVATRAATPAVLKVTPANRATDVRPDAPVTIKVSSGTLRSVALVDRQGHKVLGHIDTDGNWANIELLRPSTAYTLTVAAVGPGGMAKSVRSTFGTLMPRTDATYTVMPSGGVAGVGMPVIVQFDTPVTTKARRAEVEKRVVISSLPMQPGAWGWLDDRQLMWRPEHYWIAGSKVTVSTRLHGVQTGDGKWVTADSSSSFTVGPSMVSTVDMRKHTLTLRRNGRVIRTFPVSTGRPGPTTETRSGIKVVMERDRTVVMDSSTIGIPAGSPGSYKITTEWNLRLTWTGEFIHSAPWSVGSQGSDNVSHGCTNMAPADAEWMYRNSKVGDVVVFTGSDRPFQPAEGYGVWVYSFAKWADQSAFA